MLFFSLFIPFRKEGAYSNFIKDAVNRQKEVRTSFYAKVYRAVKAIPNTIFAK
jgi:hypothetical protein